MNTIAATPTNSTEIFQAVSEVLQDRLGVDESEVTLNAMILDGGLGADSIDVLDILHHLDKRGVRIARGPLEGLGSGAELTNEVLQQISESMTFVNFDHVKPDGVMTTRDLLTVQLLCQAAANVLQIKWQDPV